MLKLVRVYGLVNSSPIESLLGAIPAESGRRRFLLRYNQQRQQQLRLCSSSSSLGAGASTILHTRERDAENGTAASSSVENQNREQWPRVSLARCGIAKEFNGTADDFFVQQQKAGRNVFGDDACFIATYSSAYVAGVADGVGGWRRYGIDPSKFASELMGNCADIVQNGLFQMERPDLIIERAFNRLKVKHKPVGSSTACVLVVNKRTLYAANLGDSGYLICRSGEVVFRSPEQTHYFNAPYQLTLLPERFYTPAYKGKASYITDKPEQTVLRQHELMAGDLVLIASDGLWDNMPDEKIAALLDGTEPTEASLQARCNSLALIARHLSNDVHYESPFAIRAKANGINAPGGKPDDVTIVLLHIS